jgi:copper chaperone NosL
MAMTEIRTPTANESAETSSDGGSGARRGARAVRLGLGLAALALVALSARLPVWEARLSAPQYPQGLSLTAYGDRVEGDLAEINQLNHYVGVEAFDPAAVSEMRLFLPTLGLAAVAVVVGTLLAGRRFLGRLARLGLWLIPIGMLADIQFRLWQFGQSPDPTAPIRLDPFTPLVVGPTKVLNFTTMAFPGGALWALTGAAFLVTFGPGLVERVRSRGATRAPEPAP